MNTVKTESIVSGLATKPLEPIEFPFALQEVFGSKNTTLNRVRKGESNASDVPKAFLRGINIVDSHQNKVYRALRELWTSPQSISAKGKHFANRWLALEAGELEIGETITCAYKDFASYFVFF